MVQRRKVRKARSSLVRKVNQLVKYSHAAIKYYDCGYGNVPLGINQSDKSWLFHPFASTAATAGATALGFPQGDNTYSRTGNKLTIVSCEMRAHFTLSTESAAVIAPLFRIIAFKSKDPLWNAAVTTSAKCEGGLLSTVSATNASGAGGALGGSYLGAIAIDGMVEKSFNGRILFDQVFGSTPNASIPVLAAAKGGIHNVCVHKTFRFKQDIAFKSNTDINPTDGSVGIYMFSNEQSSTNACILTSMTLRWNYLDL